MVPSPLQGTSHKMRSKRMFSCTVRHDWGYNQGTLFCTKRRQWWNCSLVELPLLIGTDSSTGASSSNMHCSDKVLMCGMCRVLYVPQLQVKAV